MAPSTTLSSGLAMGADVGRAETKAPGANSQMKNGPTRGGDSNSLNCAGSHSNNKSANAPRNPGPDGVAGERGTGGSPASGQSNRCYLCETPKQSYSLVCSYSEPVCRGCLNYEGPDRIECLISDARRLKKKTRECDPEEAHLNEEGRPDECYLRAKQRLQLAPSLPQRRPPPQLFKAPTASEVSGSCRNSAPEPKPAGECEIVASPPSKLARSLQAPLPPPPLQPRALKQTDAPEVIKVCARVPGVTEAQRTQTNGATRAHLPPVHERDSPKQQHQTAPDFCLSGEMDARLQQNQNLSHQSEHLGFAPKMVPCTQPDCYTSAAQALSSTRGSPCARHVSHLSQLMAGQSASQQRPAMFMRVASSYANGVAATAPQGQQLAGLQPLPYDQLMRAEAAAMNQKTQQQQQQQQQQLATKQYRLTNSHSEQTFASQSSQQQQRDGAGVIYSPTSSLPTSYALPTNSVVGTVPGAGLLAPGHYPASTTPQIMNNVGILPQPGKFSQIFVDASGQPAQMSPYLGAAYATLVQLSPLQQTVYLQLLNDMCRATLAQQQIVRTRHQPSQQHAHQEANCTQSQYQQKHHHYTDSNSLPTPGPTKACPQRHAQAEASQQRHLGQTQVSRGDARCSVHSTGAAQVVSPKGRKSELSPRYPSSSLLEAELTNPRHERQEPAARRENTHQGRQDGSNLQVVHSRPSRPASCASDSSQVAYNNPADQPKRPCDPACNSSCVRCNPDSSQPITIDDCDLSVEEDEPSHQAKNSTEAAGKKDSKDVGASEQIGQMNDATSNDDPFWASGMRDVPANCLNPLSPNCALPAQTHVPPSGPRYGPRATSQSHQIQQPPAAEAEKRHNDMRSLDANSPSRSSHKMHEITARATNSDQAVSSAGARSDLPATSLASNKNSSQDPLAASGKRGAQRLPSSNGTGLSSDKCAPAPPHGDATQKVQLNHQPLKCFVCRERLEDRHFVQCPSVAAHKFCFACSRDSIERQQLESRTSMGKTISDKVYCPSGKRCLLSTENTPWTFMNSEIETIFRDTQQLRQKQPEIQHQRRSTSARGNKEPTESSTLNAERKNETDQKQSRALHRHKGAKDPEAKEGGSKNAPSCADYQRESRLGSSVASPPSLTTSTKSPSKMPLSPTKKLSDSFEARKRHHDLKQPSKAPLSASTDDKNSTELEC